MVQEQGDMIQRIDANTEDVVDNVEGAQRELLKYWSRVSGNRWLVAKMFGVLMTSDKNWPDGMAMSLTNASPVVSKTLENRASRISSSDYSELSRAADLSSAAYSGCDGSAFDVRITLQTNNLATNTEGFVGYSTSKQRISVVLRGSTTVQDILNDIDTTLVTPRLSGVNFPSGALVMTGVFTPWSSVHDQVVSEVRRLIGLYPSYTLESTGHSLGGSLTYLSYIALTQNFPAKSVTSNALAAFPIGNSKFANFGQSQKGLLRRGDNSLDGVPNMYTGLPYNYQHYGTASPTNCFPSETKALLMMS
ncbi:MAG: hypothetical protein Q9227_006502 [Pyrenula ochraceoflavens]